jgi:hypothetical protein
MDGTGGVLVEAVDLGWPAPALSDIFLLNGFVSGLDPPAGWRIAGTGIGC